MDITLIEELLKINNDEINSLNNLNEQVLKHQCDYQEIVHISKQERFIKVDTQKRVFGEIYYMILGSSRHNINDEALTLQEGELLFINRYAHHKINALGKDDIAIKISISEHFEDICLFCEDYLVKAILKVLLMRDISLSHFRCNISNLIPVKNIIENMTYSVLQNEKVSEETNLLYMNLFFEHIKNEYIMLKFCHEQKDIRTIMVVLKYIENNLKDGELKEISDTLLMNQYTLSRKIKKNTGYTFKELLQTKKLDRALFLLNNSDMAITKISETIGYENTSYFHKIFKEKYGVSPKKYRN